MVAKTKEMILICRNNQGENSLSLYNNRFLSLIYNCSAFRFWQEKYIAKSEKLTIMAQGGEKICDTRYEKTTLKTQQTYSFSLT